MAPDRAPHHKEDNTQMPAKKIDRTGQTYGRWYVIREAEPRLEPNGKRRTMCLCRCTGGHEAVVHSATLGRGSSTSCGRGECHHGGGQGNPAWSTLEGNPRWTGEDATYGGAHHRVRREHGSASLYRCSCGCGRQAEDWAYLGTDPNAKISAEGKSKGCLYSPNPEHYAPLARPCHKAFDIWQAQRRTDLTLGAAIVEAVAA